MRWTDCDEVTVSSLGLRATNNLTLADCGLCLGNSRRAIWRIEQINAANAWARQGKLGALRGPCRALFRFERMKLKTGPRLPRPPAGRIPNLPNLTQLPSKTLPK